MSLFDKMADNLPYVSFPFNFSGYCHPDFVLEKQYVELCQRFPGYYEYDFYKCVTTEDITLDDVQVSLEKVADRV